MGADTTILDELITEEEFKKYSRENKTKNSYLFDHLSTWEHELVNFNDSDKFEGSFLDSMLSDSLFDLWKIEYDSGSSELLQEAEQLTHDKYIEILEPRLWNDVGWQVQASAWGLLGGTIGAVIGSCVGHPWAGFHIGFFIAYGIAQISHAFKEQEKLDSFLLRGRLRGEQYEGPQTLNERRDDSTMIDSCVGTWSPIQASVEFQTDKHIYSGTVILAPSMVQKTEVFDVNAYLESAPDYSLQAKNLMGFSDFDLSYEGSGRYSNSKLEEFLFYRDGLTWENSPEIYHRENSIFYLENEILQATTENKDERLDRIVPTMLYGVPTLDFVNSIRENTESEEHAPIPRFYEEYPIYVAPESEKLDEYLTIYKIYDGSSSGVQVLPAEKLNEFKSEMKSIQVYLVAAHGESYSEYGHYQAYYGSISPDEFLFDGDLGVLTINEYRLAHMNNALYRFKRGENSKIDEYEKFFVLEISFEKYRSLDDNKDLSDVEINRIATMQTIHASVLEYFYQFRIAEDTQARLEEIAHTIKVTLISTAITMAMNPFSYMGGPVQFAKQFAISFVKEPFQEVVQDEIVDAWAADIAKQLGTDKYGQIVAAHLAESGSETAFGSVGDTVKNYFKGTYSYQQQAEIDHHLNNYDLLENIQNNLELSSQDAQESTVQSDWKFRLATSSSLYSATISPSSPSEVGFLKNVYESERISIKEQFGKSLVAADMKYDPYEGLLLGWDEKISDSERFTGEMLLKEVLDEKTFKTPPILDAFLKIHETISYLVGTWAASQVRDMDHSRENINPNAQRKITEWIKSPEKDLIVNFLNAFAIAKITKIQEVQPAYLESLARTFINYDLDNKYSFSKKLFLEHWMKDTAFDPKKSIDNFEHFVVNVKSLNKIDRFDKILALKAIKQYRQQKKYLTSVDYIAKTPNLGSRIIGLLAVGMTEKLKKTITPENLIDMLVKTQWPKARNPRTAAIKYTRVRNGKSLFNYADLQFLYDFAYKEQLYYHDPSVYVELVESLNIYAIGLLMKYDQMLVRNSYRGLIMKSSGYTSGWGTDNLIKLFTEYLRRETHDRDGSTGKPVAKGDGLRHHIRHYKSGPNRGKTITTDSKLSNLIYFSSYSNSFVETDTTKYKEGETWQHWEKTLKEVKIALKLGKAPDSWDPIYRAEFEREMKSKEPLQYMFFQL